MFLNDTDGDCVLAEECVNINTFAYNTTGQCALVTDAEIQTFGAAHRILNGADLSQVMGYMQQSVCNGLTIGTRMYFDGPPTSVDWTNRANLCSAIFASQGSIKISVDAGVLESAVGSSNGWYLASYRGTSQDHCVGLVGYGTASFCFGLCGVPVPAGVDPNSFCYLLDTWNTVGVVAAAVIESSWVGEAWLRSPTSIPIPPTTPVPTPVPGPTPTPTPVPVPAIVAGPVTLTPGQWDLRVYNRAFHYADAGSITIPTAGSYKVSLSQ
jgi:hypothetical protein